MTRGTLYWIVMYIFAAAAVAVVSYIGVSVYFNRPTIFTGYKSLSPSPSPLPPMPVTTNTPMNPTNFVKRFDQSASPVYIVRLWTVAPVRQVNKKLVGSGYFGPDLKKTVIPFELEERNGKYIIGYHENGAFGDYANKVENVPFETLIQKIPANTFVQLRIATVDLPKDEKALLINTLEQALRNNWTIPKLSFRPFAVELVR